jgi:pimeloyl-ACP methyl ester carboxylesterase
MRRIIAAAAADSVAPRRVVLLAGAYQEPEDFLQAGFAAAVRARGLALDLEFVSLQLAHLLDRSVLDALQVQVIAPARAAGCRELWLGGVSLGAYMALAFAERGGATVDGLCLLAPYLGSRMVAAEVVQAGGLQNWHPEIRADDNEERRIWAYLQQLPVGSLSVYLGLGNRDRFRDSHGLLAESLPPGTVEYAEGGHDWPTWQQLWNRFLDRLSGLSGPVP